MKTPVKPQPSQRLQPYRYKRLYVHGQPEDRIRIFVLDLNADSEPLTGKLIDVRLGDRPMYWALSYVWGDSTLSSEILCEGKRLPITESLRSALVRIRRHSIKRSASCPYLWVDAVCINQRNSSERAYQVKRMAQIYSSATGVIVWLGEPDAYNEHALDMLHWIATTMPAGWYSQGRHEWPRHLSKLFACREKSQKEWMSLVQFVKLPWFHRVWTVQEVVKAQQTLILFGASAAPWPVISAAIVLLAARCEQVADFLALPEEEMFSFWPCYTIIALEPLKKEIQSLLLVLFHMDAKQSSDPKDRIYGVLGFLPAALVDTIEVNYASTYSTEQMMRDVTIRVLQHKRSLDFLAPSPLACSFADSTGKPAPQQPSWVFDWISTKPDTMPFILEKDVYFTASNDTTFHFDLAEGASVLVVRGRPADVIAEVAALPSHPLVRAIDHPRRIQETYAVAFAGPTFSSTCVLEDETIPQVNAYISALLGGATELDVDRIHSWENRQMSRSLFLGALNAVKLALELSSAIPDPMTPPFGYFPNLLGRRFCKTRGGRYGLVPLGAEVGDVVAVLYGGKTPFILRPRSDGYYQWLGEAHVHGLMMGAAMKMDELLTQEFKIK